MVKFGGISGEQLRQLVARIEKLEEEKKEVSEFISDAYKEAKANGFDVKVLRKIISLRKRDQSQIAEEEEIMDLYKHALGMIKISEDNSNEDDSEISSEAEDLEENSQKTKAKKVA
ncbi:MAG: DUF2312 domain-containing protein [Rickettsiales bacterium]|nr:DUF2312 domain-containing protein [Rickettsiales bacterium]